MFFYVRLDRLQIEESSKPPRLSQQLQGPVTNYKPVANHSYNVRKLSMNPYKSVYSSTSYCRRLTAHTSLTFQASRCRTLIPFIFFLFYSWSMRRRRRRRAREREPTNSRSWTCCSLPLRSTSTIISKTWWTSPNSLW